jgi:hypothetical protein
MSSNISEIGCAINESPCVKKAIPLWKHFYGWKSTGMSDHPVVENSGTSFKPISCSLQNEVSFLFIKYSVIPDYRFVIHRSRDKTTIHLKSEVPNGPHPAESTQGFDNGADCGGDFGVLFSQ